MARKGVAAFVAGLVMVGGAYAGISVAPVSTDKPTDGLPVASEEAQKAAEVVATDGAAALATSGVQLPAGEFLVGADVTSIVPKTQAEGGPWQTENCVTYENDNFEEEVTHLAANLSKLPNPPGWPTSPDCIYLGGYGIGPARPATSADNFNGVGVRTLAISNGKDTVVWQMLDMVGYFNEYRADLCADCGIADLRKAVAQLAGTTDKNIAIGSTHTHGGADGYGAWGGLPTWYRTFVRDQVLLSAKNALAKMKGATIEVGQVDAREFNSQRRATYYSTPDFGAVWLQARELPVESDGKTKKKDPPPTAPPVIATLVNFAAHPTVAGDIPVMHGDWPTAAGKALGDVFGGTGLIFEGGLGNVSDRNPQPTSEDLNGDGIPGNTKDEPLTDIDQYTKVGRDFAAFIKGDIDRGGSKVTANNIVTHTETIEHPVTNWAEAGLGVAGFLDREFLPGEAAGAGGTYAAPGKASATPVRSCVSAAPNTIKTQVSGFRIGTLNVLTAPGEIFSAISTVSKSLARKDALDGGQTMIFGQTQDSLGYIIQSFEVDPAGGVLTNAEGDTFEYEETFMLDKCFGDHVVTTMVEKVRAEIEK